MKVVPKKNVIAGRMLDVARTKGGIELPSGSDKVSVLVLIDAVGPEVVDYKVGDVVSPLRVYKINLRGGLNTVVFKDEEVLAVVEDVPLDQFNVIGETPSPRAFETAGAPV